MSDPAEDALHEVSKDLETPAEVDLHEDRTKEMRTPGFARMRTDWDGPDAQTVAQVTGIVDQRILVNFSDAYALMNELYDIVREPQMHPETGEVLRDAYGFAFWARTPEGAFVEDWHRLTLRQRENLMFQITSRLFEWEQKAAQVWAEAMFSKAMFEERFALSFGQAPGIRPTVDDRTQFARKDAREERYFAIFMSLYSRRADAIVRVMVLLGQRLKDSL